MRDIKFRQPLWNEDNKFSGWHCWGFIDNSFVEPMWSPESSLKEAKEQSQQFTGLYDKNGKEYYFDDITKWNNQLWVLVQSKTLAGIQLQPVANYAARQKDVKVKRLYGPSFGIGQAHCSEKIGNQTDNPELLEQGK